MSRCFIFILVFFILAGLTVTAAAEAAPADGTPYKLDALDLTVNLPEDFTVVTRGFDPNDPAIARLGLDGKTLGDYFVSKNIYLDGISGDKVSEFLVIIPDSSASKSYPDFKLYSDDALRRNSGDLVTDLQNQGAGNIAVDVYGDAQAKYLKLDFVLTTTQVPYYREMYCTVIGGKMIMLALDSFGQPPAETQQDSLKHIVDGLTYGKTSAGVISGSLTHGLFIFGINLEAVVLTGVVGVAAIGLICLIFGRQRSANRTLPAPPLAPSSGWTYPEQSYDDRESPEPHNDRPIPKQIICPNCCAINLTNSRASSARCAECGATLERDTSKYK